jgi:hypothetical protein
MSATEANERSPAHPGTRGTPEHQSGLAKRRNGPPLVLALALAVGIPALGGAAVAGGWARCQFGSSTAAFAFLRGESFLLEPQPIDLGSVKPREKRFLTMRAINLTGRTIAINGINAVCAHSDGCVLCTDHFPMVVQPRGSHALTLEYEFKGQPEARSIHLATEAYTEIGIVEIALEGRIDGGAPRARP